MPALSIIVPVYKTEKYLPKCIDSILAQTFADFELILIDDGSPDRSGQICDEYAQKDSRIIVIHQENKGVSAARNAGLDIAKGEHIGFVDSDDWIEPEMYSAMMDAQKENDYDVTFCGIIYCNENGEQERVCKLKLIGKETKEELLSALFLKPIPIGGSCCCGLFQKTNIGNRRFNTQLQMKEDVVFMFDVLQCCESGNLMEECYYHIREQSKSATRSCLSEALVNTIPGNRVLLKKAIAHSKELGSLASDKSLDDSIRFIRMIKQDSSVDKRQKRRMVSRVKAFYWEVLISSVLHQRLTRTQIHRCFFDYLHL